MGIFNNKLLFEIGSFVTVISLMATNTSLADSSSQKPSVVFEHRTGNSKSAWREKKGNISAADYDRDNPQTVVLSVDSTVSSKKLHSVLLNIEFNTTEDAKVFKRAIDTGGSGLSIGPLGKNIESALEKSPLDDKKPINPMGAMANFAKAYVYGINLELSTPIYDNKTNKTMDIAAFIKVARERQRREDELKSGDYRGVLGLFHKMGDKIRGAGIYSSKNSQETSIVSDSITKTIRTDKSSSLPIAGEPCSTVTAATNE